ncbi:MAG: hypothetical protein ABH883_00415, partial [Candidatus Omnitrophota bacterium]
MKARNFFYRSISILVLFSFLIHDLCWPQAELPGGFYSGDTRLNNIVIPEGAGKTEQEFSSPGDEVIVHIQDSHASLSAQDSIVKLLDYMTKNYKLSLVAIEGANGYVDTSLLKTFPDEQARKDTAKYLMSEGFLGAGEFFSIVNNSEVAVYGVEDPLLYKNNLEKFRGIIDTREVTMPVIEEVLKIITELERNVYSKELFTLVKNSYLHKQGTMSFSEYWPPLKTQLEKFGISISDCREIANILECISLEQKIDFIRANSQRRALIDEMSEKIPRAQFEDTVLQALQFKKKDISEDAFHGYLLKRAEENVLDTAKYPDFLKYARYMEKFLSIDLIHLQLEVAKLEEKLRTAIFRNEDEKLLYNAREVLSSFKQLYSLELTDAEVSSLKNGFNILRSPDIFDFLKKMSLKYAVSFPPESVYTRIYEGLAPALEFYTEAESRSRAMIDNTVRKMRKHGKHIAALITGGYHTKGLTDLMRDKKLSYLVVSPKYPDEESRPYVAVLTNKRSVYEDILATGKYQIAVEAYFQDRGNKLDVVLPALFYALGQVALRESPEKTAEIKREWLKMYAARYNTVLNEIGAEELANKVSIQEFEDFLFGIDARKINRTTVIIVCNKGGESIYRKLKLQDGSYKLYDNVSSSEIKRFSARTVFSGPGKRRTSDFIPENEISVYTDSSRPYPNVACQAAIIGPEVSPKEAEEWIQEIDNNAEAFMVISKLEIKLEINKYKDLFKKWSSFGGKNIFKDKLKAIGVNKKDIKLFLEQLESPEKSFIWFTAKILSEERFLLGTKDALALDLFKELVKTDQNEQLTKSRPQFITIEYVMHELLHRIPTLDHKKIIDITHAVFQRGNGKSRLLLSNPLGEKLRQYINRKAAGRSRPIQRPRTIAATTTPEAEDTSPETTPPGVTVQEKQTIPDNADTAPERTTSSRFPANSTPVDPGTLPQNTGEQNASQPMDPRFTSCQKISRKDLFAKAPAQEPPSAAQEPTEAGVSLAQPQKIIDDMFRKYFPEYETIPQVEVRRGTSRLFCDIDLLNNKILIDDTAFKDSSLKDIVKLFYLPYATFKFYFKNVASEDYPSLTDCAIELASAYLGFFCISSENDMLKNAGNVMELDQLFYRVFHIYVPDIRDFTSVYAKLDKNYLAKIGREIAGLDNTPESDVNLAIILVRSQIDKITGMKRRTQEIEIFIKTVEAQIREAKSLLESGNDPQPDEIRIAKHSIISVIQDIDRMNETYPVRKSDLTTYRASASAILDNLEKKDAELDEERRKLRRTELEKRFSGINDQLEKLKKRDLHEALNFILRAKPDILLLSIRAVQDPDEKLFIDTFISSLDAKSTELKNDQKARYDEMLETALGYINKKNLKMAKASLASAEQFGIRSGITQKGQLEDIQKTLKNAEIENLLEKAEGFKQRAKTRKAMEIVQQILDMDPKNTRAAALSDELTSIADRVDEKKTGKFLRVVEIARSMGKTIFQKGENKEPNESQELPAPFSTADMIKSIKLLLKAPSEENLLKAREELSLVPEKYADIKNLKNSINRAEFGLCMRKIQEYFMANDIEKAYSYTEKATLILKDMPPVFGPILLQQLTHIYQEKIMSLLSDAQAMALKEDFESSDKLLANARALSENKQLDPSFTRSVAEVSAQITRKKIEDWMRQAKIYEDFNKPDDAAGLLEKVIQIDTANTDAKTRLMKIDPARLARILKKAEQNTAEAGKKPIRAEFRKRLLQLKKIVSAKSGKASTENMANEIFSALIELYPGMRGLKCQVVSLNTPFIITGKWEQDALKFSARYIEGIGSAAGEEGSDTTTALTLGRFFLGRKIRDKLSSEWFNRREKEDNQDQSSILVYEIANTLLDLQNYILLNEHSRKNLITILEKGMPEDRIIADFLRGSLTAVKEAKKKNDTDLASAAKILSEDPSIQKCFDTIVSCNRMEISDAEKKRLYEYFASSAALFFIIMPPNTDPAKKPDMDNPVFETLLNILRSEISLMFDDFNAKKIILDGNILRRLAFSGKTLEELRAILRPKMEFFKNISITIEQTPVLEKVFFSDENLTEKIKVLEVFKARFDLETLTFGKDVLLNKCTELKTAGFSPETISARVFNAYLSGGPALFLRKYFTENAAYMIRLDTSYVSKIFKSLSLDTKKTFSFIAERLDFFKRIDLNPESVKDLVYSDITVPEFEKRHRVLQTYRVPVSKKFLMYSDNVLEKYISLLKEQKIKAADITPDLFEKFIRGDLF